jgi:cytochrome P450
MQQVIRWTLRHGVYRWVMGRRARQGDLVGLLVTDPRAVADPHPYYDALRAQGKLVRIGTGLTFVSTHHDASVEVLRSKDFGAGRPMPETLSPAVRLAGWAGGQWPLSPVQPPSMLAVDPPDHTRYRKLVTRAFSAKAIAELNTSVEQIAEELLDELDAAADDAGTVDLIDRYALLLPAKVIAHMLGAEEKIGQFKAWGTGTSLSLDIGLSYPDMRRSEQALASLLEWLSTHLQTLRQNPGPNILSDLVAVRDGNDRLTPEELASIAMLLLVGGFETTTTLISSGTQLLMDHRDQLALLRAEPDRWKGAVEEILRFTSPAQILSRRALRDTEICGHRIPRGAFILLYLGGANRDPAVFSNPHTFDIARTDTGQHIAFGNGIHHCLGASLARMEGQVALRALFNRFPHLAPAEPARLRPTRVVRGYTTFPVTLGTPSTTPQRRNSPSFQLSGPESPAGGTGCPFQHNGMAQNANLGG